MRRTPIVLQSPTIRVFSNLDRFLAVGKFDGFSHSRIVFLDNDLFPLFGGLHFSSTTRPQAETGVPHLLFGSGLGECHACDRSIRSAHWKQ